MRTNSRVTHGGSSQLDKNGHGLRIAFSQGLGEIPADFPILGIVSGNFSRGWENSDFFAELKKWRSIG
ncbi:MAG: hypothetical protein V1929_06320 [bacterium]